MAAIAINLETKVSNIILGKSGALAATSPAAARALMWQDLAQGRIERPDIATNVETQMTTQLEYAHAYIADAERIANSQLTRIDAAINAIALLEPTALFDVNVERYLHLKYARPLTDSELTFYYATTLGMAHLLLSKHEDEPQSNPVTLAAIEAAKSAEVTDVSCDDL